MPYQNGLFRVKVRKRNFLKEISVKNKRLIGIVHRKSVLIRSVSIGKNNKFIQYAQKNKRYPIDSDKEKTADEIELHPIC